MIYNCKKTGIYWTKRVEEKSHYQAVLHIGRAEYINEFYSQWINELVFKLIPPSVKTIVDVGCGFGRLSLPLSEKYRVFAIDISLGMIKNFKDKIKDGTKKNLFLINGAVPDLPFKKNSIDCIIATELIFHLSTQMTEETFKEFNSILKPDGVLIVTTNNSNSIAQKSIADKEFSKKNGYFLRFYSFTETKKLAKKANFKIKDIYGDPLQSLLNYLDQIRFFARIIKYSKNKVSIIWKPFYKIASFLDRRRGFGPLSLKLADHFLIIFEKNQELLC